METLICPEQGQKEGAEVLVEWALVLLSCGAESGPQRLWQMTCPMEMSAASGPPAASGLKHLQPENEDGEEKVSSLNWP